MMLMIFPQTRPQAESRHTSCEIAWNGWSNLENLLFGPVQAFARPVRFDKVVIADHREYGVGLITWMHRKVHAGCERHRLVRSHERPLDQVVALAVAV